MRVFVWFPLCFEIKGNWFTGSQEERKEGKGMDGIEIRESRRKEGGEDDIRMVR